MIDDRPATEVVQKFLYDIYNSDYTLQIRMVDRPVPEVVENIFCDLYNYD